MSETPGNASRSPPPLEEVHIKVSDHVAPTPPSDPSQRWNSEPKPTPTPLVSSPEFTPFRTWLPWLVPCFVAINVVLFIVTMYVNDCPRNAVPGSKCILGFLGRFSFQSLSENPLLGPSSTTLLKMGALDTNKIVEGRQAWRLFTCIWLHAGVFHILANMLSLLFIGIRLEREFGFVRIGVLYIVSGFGGSLLSALFLQTSISVGASGALFGLLGSMLSELLINWTIYANKLAALLTLIFIVIVNLAFGILPHVDNFAHIGGFLSGFLLGFVFLIRPQYAWINQKNPPPGFVPATLKPKHKTYQYVLLAVSMALLIVGFTLGLVALFRGADANKYCTWCHYLSCVPTSRWSCQNQHLYCLAEERSNLLNLTCVTNGRSRMYSISDDNVLLENLCSNLCGNN
ncbi:hypothetical protein MLD38_025212 [Melastoma candidum]|uniref:Uncharacterized protein n=1 Tax=Melastoma candidum TaxID=119954 RepID=A0ACB9NXJ2_9MYRT|nr:hypothetical protein MLD38_025212 [Melastoma candidum]